MKRMYVVLVLASVLSACIPDLPTEEFSSETNPALENYFAAFEREAALRGFDINLADHDLISTIDEIEEDGVAGTCHYNSQESNRITIDLSFWRSANTSTRELVVFHELGHCVLFRDHLEDENNQNTCLSIMNSGTSGCNVRYANNREYYLDELFSLD